MTQNTIRKRLIFFIGLAAMVLLGWQLFFNFGGGISNAEKRELKANGMKGVAVLHTIERTGTIVNNIHQYAFGFRITPDSGSTFPFHEKKLIDPIYMPSIKVGMSIPVYVMPDDNSKVWILWEEAGIKDAF